jgi:hypothetical protein
LRGIAGNQANDLRAEMNAVNGEERLLHLREYGGSRACDGVISEVINLARQPANHEIYQLVWLVGPITTMNNASFKIQANLQEI